MKSDGIIKLLIFGVGGYVLYQYLVSSGLWAQWFGGGAASATGAVAATSGPGITSGGGTTVPTTGPVTTTPPPSSNNNALQSQLQNYANQFMTNTGAQGLNVDQWVFYYQTVRNTTLSGGQVEAIIQALGLTDATRGTLVTVSQFLTALGSTGLSGIVTVPNAGPIINPLPSQSFNKGFGGYGSNGRLTRGNGYVQ